MTNIKTILGVKKPIIGMIHLSALPGTPNNNLSPEDIILKAMIEAQTYLDAGVDGIMIENMHDVPYCKNSVGHEISSLMSIIAYEVKKLTKLPCGIQILSAANQAALAVAKNAGLNFIRAEGFVFGHLADEGYIDSCAAELLRFRKHIGAEDVAIWTDVKKKHSSHAITQDVDIGNTAEAAEFFLSDAIVITGTSTGKSVELEDIKSVKRNSKLPIIIGSGITIDNIEHYYPMSDGFIIGSHFKQDGHWQKDVDSERVGKFIQRVERLKSDQ